MQFGQVQVEFAQGAILAHGVKLDTQRFRKGRRLSADDIAALKAAGIVEVTVARLEGRDIGEDEAAARLAQRAAGTGIRTAAPFTGRVNLYAQFDGLAVVDADVIDALNRLDEAITIATVPSYARVTKGQMVATIKIIPFAAPRPAVEAGEQILRDGVTPVSVVAFIPKQAGLISTFLAQTKPGLLDKNRSALEERLTRLGSAISFERRVAHETNVLAAAIGEALSQGANPILIFGASAITDRRDVIPSAVEAAGGKLTHFGMPVDPGNLLLLAHKGATTVIGLPSCARSPKLNGFDFVLWRVLAEVPLGRSEITSMGVGGLLTEIPTRPQPRDEPPASLAHSPKIGAIVLAAGLSSRMGSNKLLANVRGKPLVRHGVEAVLGSGAHPVVVVTGNGSESVKQAIAPLAPIFVENPDYSKGLSTSLKSGIRSLPSDVDGALIVLGDMPLVSSQLLDRLIAAFDPSEERAICVATRHGRRGNPVLFAKRFFSEILALEGDIGARQLILQYPDVVCEVEAPDDGPFTDIDTPDALAAFVAGAK